MSGAEPAVSATDVTSDYVRCAARFLDLPLDESQVQRVALHLGRTRLMVEGLRHAPLVPEDEPAEIFMPAPFPAEDPQ